MIIEHTGCTAAKMQFSYLHCAQKFRFLMLVTHLDFQHVIRLWPGFRNFHAKLTLYKDKRYWNIMSRYERACGVILKQNIEFSRKRVENECTSMKWYFDELETSINDGRFSAQTSVKNWSLSNAQNYIISQRRMYI